MSRRSLTLLIASVGTAVAIAVSVLVPVPYVILGPGPTLNTLGKDSSGQPLITISGHASYPTTGHLNMVTVSYQGCQGNRFNVFTALVAWLNPHQAVVPESEICPAGQTQKQTQEQDTQEMTSSQADRDRRGADPAAHPLLRPGGRDAAGEGLPGLRRAQGRGRDQRGGRPAGDQPGRPEQADLRAPGRRTLTLTITRDGQNRQVQVGTRQSGGHPVMGVQISGQYQFPFQVKISVGDIGGPSAGMMFALGIIDKLTKLDLTAGRFIAGTGEITPGGQVQPIGGIQQKMIGARNAGATVFLTPAGQLRGHQGRRARRACAWSR